MTDNDQSAAVTRAVREWTARHSGVWTTDDEQRLTGWLAAEPAHQRAYDSVAQLWEATGDLPLPAARPNAPRRHRLFSRRSAALIASTLAAVLLLIPAGSRLQQWWSGTPQHVATRIGEQKTLRLSDNSTITLDADSDLIYQVGYGQRRATLQRGEALFSVTQDARRPFEVAAGAGRIVDLGTKFDVEVRRGAVRVSVLEGRVGISSSVGGVELAAGQAAGYDAVGSLSMIETVDDSVADWRKGKRVFHDMPLGQVLETLERYQPVHFELSDPALAELRVSGVFQVTNLRAFLVTLEGSFPVRARWLDAHHIELRPVI